MKSKVVAFRVSDDVYQEFEQKCKDEGVSQTVKLRELVDGVCHDKVEKPELSGETQVKVINVEGDKLEKVTRKDSKKKSWFPLDFSPLFGKD
jgi:hypothetical protein